MSAVTGFNSRARMGRDCDQDGNNSNRRVSTHAPAWGAIRNRISKNVGYGFNSRARMGRDKALAGKVDDSFVSTHAPAWGAIVPIRAVAST